MATSSTSRTCLRQLTKSRISAQPSRIFLTSQRDFHAPAPLYLDFLAPSWKAHRPQSVAPRQPTMRSPYTQTQCRLLSSTPAQRAVAITNPRKDDDGNEMIINITPRAAHRLQTISETDKNTSLALRVSVESGGCHGFQYLMSLVNASDVDPSEDTIFENEEVAKKGGDYKAKVVIDEPSLELLKGSSIDYTMELIGSQFKVTGIPGATSSCGCGSSFDIAA
ncbi:[4Fe-4S] proteins maturation [Vermiconidia calcicola]|uniref:[4Fe-4S] proteins maturation n=1 Tax=Vermiconidia calcicola TaxID=1690605 RepID=A0ACC3NYY3_9PEZI|nr:[4Fe-4S] proteins maturation [Vermiconidia calcicola]